MTAELLHKIVSEDLFPGTKSGATLVETHISWVILTQEFAFKLKKPVRYDFLDFSTLEQRHYFCEEELRLNRRLAPNMYLGVLPVSKTGIGTNDLPVLDYALQMHRMDNAREMDKLLHTGDISDQDMEHLAALLADFHLKNRLPADHSYEPESDAHDFADLYAMEADLMTLKAPEVGLLRHWSVAIPAFLKTHANRSDERIRDRFWIEGHGDLHSRNIFLPENQAPIVFDCIEFNQHFRCGDVLNELAFLCMDLEFYDRKDLADAFLKAYTKHWNCYEKPEDALLFTYFKAYRANVRLKVTLLELRQHPNESRSKTALAYWALLKHYVQTIV